MSLKNDFGVSYPANGLRKLFLADSDHLIATIAPTPEGDAIMSAIINGIAKEGGSLLNLDSGEYLAGTLDQIAGGAFPIAD